MSNAVEATTMHCIVISSPSGTDSWRIHRSIEILAYRRREQRVTILFTLLAENRLPDRPNALRLLHRGKVTCRLIPPWPLPRHPFESKSAKGILEKVYGQAFQRSENGLSRVRALTSRDSWNDISPTPVFLGPEDKNNALTSQNVVPPEVEVLDSSGYIAFTTWQLEPFTQQGLYLLSFTLEFSGETYRKLVESEPTFTIDGPMRLLARIEYSDLDRSDKNTYEISRKHLADFKNPRRIINCESYDVIILGPPLGDQVEIDEIACPVGICSAPLQPNGNAQRFLTDNQFFTLGLAYSLKTSLLPGQSPEHPVDKNHLAI
jgi:hypothetical protein